MSYLKCSKCKRTAPSVEFGWAGELYGDVFTCTRCGHEFADFETVYVAEDTSIYDDYLKYLCDSVFPDKYPEQTQEQRDRLDHELDVITSKGFSAYFLITWDIMVFAHSNNIPVAPGRGSVMGSMVAYLLDIIELDPLQFDIPFWRFLNHGRDDMPDIDSDFCYRNRHLIIEYVVNKYGEGKVAQIITYGTMMARAVIKDVSRVFHISDKDAAAAVKEIPEEAETSVTIDELIELYPGFRDALSNLRHQDTGKHMSEVIAVIKRLEGLRRHGSAHAGGVIISTEPLVDIVPLYKRGSNSKDDTIKTQYDMVDLNDLGLLKMDLLGLRTMTVLGDIQELVRRDNPDFSWSNISIQDKGALDMIGSGDCTGIFQLEGHGFRAVARKMAPNRFEDIPVLLALYRPGPMEFIDEYIARKDGKREPTVPHPDLEPILLRSYGIIVFQEQVMQIAMKLAGYNATEADKFRKAIGKKKKDLLDAELAKFRERANANNYDSSIVDRLVDSMVTFARYGFNIGHRVSVSLHGDM